MYPFWTSTSQTRRSAISPTLAPVAYRSRIAHRTACLSSRQERPLWHLGIACISLRISSRVYIWATNDVSTGGLFDGITNGAMASRATQYSKNLRRRLWFLRDEFTA